MTTSDRGFHLRPSPNPAAHGRRLLPVMGLTLLASGSACRESRPFPEPPPPKFGEPSRFGPQPEPWRQPPPPPIDAMEAPSPPPDAYVPRPDAAPPPGLGPYANLHEAFKARCPLTLPEPPPGLGFHDKEFLSMRETGRSCRARRDGQLSTLRVDYTEGDSEYFAEPRGAKDGYDRAVGNVDSIELRYRSRSPGRHVKECDTIPKELASLYQLTAGISDRATARLAATLRVADRVVPPNAYGRVRIEDRVLYTSTDLGPRDPQTDCRGQVESGETLGFDPVIVDVPLAEQTDQDGGN